MSKILVIGGVAGGATAAGRLRRLLPEAEIIMFDKGKYMSFANCGLPYHIGGAVEKAEDLLLVTPEHFSKTYNIDVRLENEVLSIHPDEKYITVRNEKNGETYKESYDKMILSTGAKPRKLQLPGINMDGVVRLHSYGDMLEIKEYIDTKNPKTAVVIGGGFIGLEMVENFHQGGLEVHLVQRSEQIFGVLDEDMTLPLEQVLKDQGVKLHLKTNFTGITEKNGKKYVTTKEGEEIQGDIILLSVGIEPQSQLAEGAGLNLGEGKAIVTNNRMETSNPDIYAVGDVVEVTHVVSGQSTYIALAGPAQMQARIAAENIAGGDSRYKGSYGSSILKLFDVNAAYTGLNSKQAKNAGFQFSTALISSISHAGYYPGAEEFSLKVIYEEFTGRILGGQVVGGIGVDKRCDILATAIAGNLTAWDLEDLQLCYAPPFGIPRDAINIIGGIITSSIENKVTTNQCTRVVKEIKEDSSTVLLDIRSRESFNIEHADSAVNIPYTELLEDMDLLDKDKTYYVLCNSGHTSKTATRMLVDDGFNAINICGGWQVYKHLLKD